MEIILIGLTHSFSTLLSLFEREQGYLDPGSGSYIIQLIIASLMGALFMLGVYRRRVADFFRNLFSRRSNNDDPEQ